MLLVLKFKIMCMDFLALLLNGFPVVFFIRIKIKTLVTCLILISAILLVFHI